MKATVIKAKIPNRVPFGGMPMVFTDEDVGFLVVPGDPEGLLQRSEERRVGKECRSRWSPYH